jgi:hypothetical protein
MTSGTWFDNLARALAGGGGDGSGGNNGNDGGRRSFLRLLIGGVAGGALGAVLPRESDAAPADQAACSPRPRVVVTNTPTPSGLSVSVASTGTGNALQRITFGPLRNGVIDVAGVVTGAGSGYSYAVPAGASQTAFAVRATDPSQVVQIPFTVRDGCGDWRTFVGTGAGALQNPAVVCPSGQTTLTAAAPAGSTSLQVANPGCFTAGTLIRLNPGDAAEEELEIASVSVSAAATRGLRSQATGGTVTTTTSTRIDHFPDSEVFRRLPVGYTCFAAAIIDQCSLSAACCTQGNVTAGVCCPLGLCCNGRCCSAETTCCDGHCCAASQTCCPISEGSATRMCVDEQTDVSHCGSCGNDCHHPNIGGNVCIGGHCYCRSAANVNNPPCGPGVECISGQCCPFPRDCGPTESRHCCNPGLYCSAGNICCPTSTVGCGTGCCAQAAMCVNHTSCKDCLECVGGDRVDVATNTCRCGSGGLCNLAAGQICQNGTCICALVTPEKPKLCELSCNPGDRFVTGTTVGPNDSCPGGDPLCTL